MRIPYDNPVASGMCQLSGLMIRQTDAIEQMEYKGKGLVSRGIWVHKDFADKPNPQGLTPPVYGDPKPVKNPLMKIPNPDQNLTPLPD